MNVGVVGEGDIGRHGDCGDGRICMECGVVSGTFGVRESTLKLLGGGSVWKEEKREAAAEDSRQENE